MGLCDLADIACSLRVASPSEGTARGNGDGGEKQFWRIISCRFQSPERGSLFFGEREEEET